MKHISESIIGKKGTRMDKRALSDGDVVKVRNGNYFIFISPNTIDRHLDYSVTPKDGALICASPNWWVSNKLDLWEEDLSLSDDTNFDIMELYKARPEYMTQFYKIIMMRDKIKRGAAITQYIIDIKNNINPIKVR